jgi:hypothetical protein
MNRRHAKQPEPARIVPVPVVHEPPRRNLVGLIISSFLLLVWFIYLFSTAVRVGFSS